MSRASSRRRVTLAAAGLTLSVVMIGCGRARGERAGADSAAVADSAIGYDAGIPAAPMADPNANVNAAAPTTPIAPAERTPSMNATSTRRARSSRYEVPATPDDRVTVRNRDAAVEPVRAAETPAENAPTPEPFVPVAVTRTSAVTACFAADKGDLEYPSARTDAMDARQPMAGDAGERSPVPVGRDSNLVTDRAMAPTDAARTTTRAEVAAVPDTAARVDVTVTTDTLEGLRIVPCMESGEKKGSAAGAFLNDAQVAHAFLIANTIDSAVAEAALVRSQNPDVRRYAEMMIRDHTAANARNALILQRTSMSPAENDISDAKLRAVMALAEEVKAEPASVTTSPATPPAANVVVTDSTTRDTLSTSRFARALNMNPWSSLLAGMQGDPDHSNVQAAKDAANYIAPNPNAPAPVVTATVTKFDREYADYTVESHQNTLDALDTRLIPHAGNAELKALLIEARPTVAAHLEAARQLQRSLNSGTPSTTQPY